VIGRERERERKFYYYVSLVYVDPVIENLASHYTIDD
jgi:hypothetical protein